MNRHRAGMAISEESMRFVRFEDIALAETPLLRDSDDRKIASIRRSMETAARAAEEAYAEIMSVVEMEGVKKFKEKKIWTSLARRVAPMGVATGGVWTGNLRALRHIFTMRCAPAAEEEIREVAGMMLEQVRGWMRVFADFQKDPATDAWQPKFLKV